MMGMILETQAKSRFLYITAAGEFSFQEAKKTFLEMLDTIGLHKSQRVLFDGQKIIGEPETMERFYYGEFVAEAIYRAVATGSIPCSPKLAYVLKPPVLDSRRLGETVAFNRGVDVRAFESPQDAIDWLLQR